ncbi:MAG: hypothetical protein AAF608_05080 [Pseudomonadota bacterium]
MSIEDIETGAADVQTPEITEALVEIGFDTDNAFVMELIDEALAESFVDEDEDEADTADE